MLILDEVDKIRTPEQIDQVVQANIPSPEINSELHALVAQFMIHGPCGNLNGNSACMENNLCTKQFPKEFKDSTSLNRDGFPSYKRPNDGILAAKGNIYATSGETPIPQNFMVQSDRLFEAIYGFWNAENMISWVILAPKNKHVK